MSRSVGLRRHSRNLFFIVTTAILLLKISSEKNPEMMNCATKIVFLILLNIAIASSFFIASRVIPSTLAFNKLSCSYHFFFESHFFEQTPRRMRRDSRIQPFAVNTNDKIEDVYFKDPRLLPISDLLERQIVKVEYRCMKFENELMGLEFAFLFFSAQVWRKEKAPPQALFGGARGAGHSAASAGQHVEPDEIIIVGTSHLSAQSATDVERVVS
jgi:hypothetical protein